MRILNLDPAAKAGFRYLSLHHPRWLCRLKMIRNHTIESDQRFWELYAEGLGDDVTVQPLEDFFNLYQLVQRTQKLEGELAELGVYRGGTAKLIASLKGNKTLHLFDTFAGMPEVRGDLDQHRAGHFDRTSLAEVKRYLSGFSGLFFHPGFFPDSAGELAKTPIRFSLVHLDADIYESTKAGLHFFYPRMVKGAVILSHDYRNLSCPGVKQAVDEFFADKPETVIELWKTQCLVVKQ
ncbi:MAG: TylF/MycF family methyltransferase [Verrucomicrobia bacterium]|nr:TylF/MycF family methyltransferase [Verrucomicrobiota bacterium]